MDQLLGIAFLKLLIFYLIIACWGGITFFIFKYFFKIKLNSFYKLSLGLFFTLLVIIIGYSCYHTQFVTNNIFLIPLILLFIYKNKNNQDESGQLKLNRSTILIIFILPLFSFLLFEPRNFGISIDDREIVLDNYFYSLISRGLTDFGNENYYHSYADFNEKYSHPSGYHFLELWLNSLFTKIVGYNNHTNFYSFTYPSIFFLLSICLIAIAEAINNKKINYWILVLVPFLDGRLFNEAGLQFMLGGYFLGSILTSPLEFKYYWFYIILIFALTDQLKGRNVNCLMYFTALQLFNKLYIPISACYIIYYFTENYISKKKPDYLVCCICLAIIFTNAYFGSHYKVEVSSIRFFDYDGSLGLMKRIKYPMLLLIFSFTSIVLYFYPIAKIFLSKDKMALHILFILCISSVFYSLLYFNPDSIQLYNSVQYGCLFVLIYIAVYKYCFLKPNWFFTIFLVFICFLNAFLTFKDLKIHHKKSYYSFSDKGKKLASSIKNESKVALFKSYFDLKFQDNEFNPFFKTPFIAFDCFEVLFESNAYPVAIYDFEVLKNKGPYKKEYENIMKSGALYAFTNNKAQNVTIDNYDVYIFEFLKKNQIKFILTSSPTDLPKYLLLKSKSIITDKGVNASLVEIQL